MTDPARAVPVGPDGAHDQTEDTAGVANRAILAAKRWRLYALGQSSDANMWMYYGERWAEEITILRSVYGTVRGNITEELEALKGRLEQAATPEPEDGKTDSYRHDEGKNPTSEVERDQLSGMLRLMARRSTGYRRERDRIVVTALRDLDGTRAELSAVRARLDRHRAALAELVRLRHAGNGTVAGWVELWDNAWTEARSVLAEDTEEQG